MGISAAEIVAVAGKSGILLSLASRMASDISNRVRCFEIVPSRSSQRFEKWLTNRTVLLQKFVRSSNDFFNGIEGSCIKSTGSSSSFVGAPGEPDTTNAVSEGGVGGGGIASSDILQNISKLTACCCQSLSDPDSMDFSGILIIISKYVAPHKTASMKRMLFYLAKEHSFHAGL
jgi:hypothetical protein